MTITDPFKHFVGMLPEKIVAMLCMMPALKPRNPERRVDVFFVGTRTSTSEK